MRRDAVVLVALLVLFAVVVLGLSALSLRLFMDERFLLGFMISVPTSVAALWCGRALRLRLEAVL